MATVSFKLLPTHGGEYPVNTLIRAKYDFVDDEGNYIERENPEFRMSGPQGSQYKDPKLYKFPGVVWSVDDVRQKQLYEYLRDHPFNTESIAYKRNVLGYTLDDEKEGLPMPEQPLTIPLFKTIDENKERKVRMAVSQTKQQAALALAEKVGVIGADGNIDFVENGKATMNKVYYLLNGKNEPDVLAAFEALLQLSESAPDRLTELLNSTADVYNHKVRVGKWIADGVITEVDKTLYLAGVEVGTRASLEARSASASEDDIAFCKNLDEQCKPAKGRPKKNAI